MKDGSQVLLYKESYALVIGVSRYTRGWSDLPGVKEDIRDVKVVLEDHGFHVTTLPDPNLAELEQGIKNFITTRGMGTDNRLLIYFAGHGHTVAPKYGGAKLGYLVPRGAPNPYEDLRGFKSKALSFKRIEEYALSIDAKHAVFIFDACFSGSLLSMVRAVPEEINNKTAKPVRQFFTSGNEKEKVPDKSIFKAQFVAALNGEGDLNRDGYVTGTELGSFLQKNVARYSRETQHPQYGTIRNPYLDKGDFVFILPETNGSGRISGGSTNNPSTPAWTAGGPDPEYELWKRVEKSTDPEDFKFFLSEYPKGKYGSTARYMIRKLAKNSAPSQGAATISSTNNNKPVRPRLPSPGDTWTEPVTGMVFVWVPGDCFQMGDTFGDGASDEKPVHQVCLDGFWMGKTEVTQGQWKKIMGNNPSRFKSGDSYPVETVSWHDAKKFISKLNTKSGQEFKLPSEAQWEYAARDGGKKVRFGTGKNIISSDEANFDARAEYKKSYSRSGQYREQTTDVGSFAPNGLGLYDMSGNVYEWCEDVYDENAYAKHAPKNPLVSSGSSSRVLRGGGWGYDPRFVRAAYRYRGDPGSANSYLGFRVCAPRVR
ncbi:SUMF1/EgtB/PvdO family nonheme iron enzyme [Desulfobacter latus]|uniref:SUMF1/EgtB/PvdO family nonheme iron enzyme n=1 Tax=Desulfobacter latus TaxID=2292 RepID=A0A850T049_9BACT|nr:SUMF1/EgtB/PvdO family nonheme iron enzyme [Desulfobacter latus]